MVDTPIGPAQLRIIQHLKRSGPCITTVLAAALEVTTQAVRPPLAELENRGLVVAEPVSTGVRGRPPFGWALSSLAMDLFPDRHRDLTVELLAAVRDALGEDALARVLAERDRKQCETIEARMTADATVPERVDVLARVRAEQGYMAEVVPDGDGLLLIEHHCPVCVAATRCPGLCNRELELFRAVVGSDAKIERTHHLLSGDERCVYRIRTVSRP